MKTSVVEVQKRSFPIRVKKLQELLSAKFPTYSSVSIFPDHVHLHFEGEYPPKGVRAFYYSMLPEEFDPSPKDLYAQQLDSYRRKGSAILDRIQFFIFDLKMTVGQEKAIFLATRNIREAIQCGLLSIAITLIDDIPEDLVHSLEIKNFIRGEIVDATNAE